MDARATNAYWGRTGLERLILEALAAAGKHVDALTIDDLAPADQFHSGGKNATQRLAGPVQPVVFPVMWARDAAASFLRPPGEMRGVIAATGFQVRAWDDVTAEAVGPSTGASGPAHGVQRIVMGEALDAIVRAGQRNREEGRILMIQAVAERRSPPASAPPPRTSPMR